MARFSFGLFGQDTNELLAGQKVKIKNVDTGQFVASTSPEGSQLRIYDNNDGTYFVDGLPSGLYSVYVNSDTNVQEELQNVPFYNEEVKAHLADLTIHRSINDAGTGATNLWSAAKIIAQLALKGDLSALNALTAVVSGKANIEHTHSEYLGASGVSSDFQIINNVLNFKPNFLVQNILSNNMNLNQNLELLQNAINSMTGILGGSGSSGYRIIYSDSVRNLVPSYPLDFDKYILAKNSNGELLLTQFFKFPTDLKLLIAFEMSCHTYLTQAPELIIFVDDVEVSFIPSNKSTDYICYSIPINIVGFNSSEFHDVKIQYQNLNPDYDAKLRKLQILVG